MSEEVKNLSHIVKDEAIRLICGKLLGKGRNRTVFVYALDKTKVIKFEDSDKSFQNIIEWETWLATEKEARKWLAPCRHISSCGTVLIMDRTTPVPINKMPNKMPVWLSDFKLEIYGRIGKRIVCHDYGLSFPISRSTWTSATRKVDWWSIHDNDTEISS